MNKIKLNLQLACKYDCFIPTKIDFLNWLKFILPLHIKYVEITIRLVNKEEIYKLNSIYLRKNNYTNILSFCFDYNFGIKFPLLGDLVICCKIIEEEAKQQKKKLKEHWAHMVIHGTLHLLGYNHIIKKEAKKMEFIEKKIMYKLGYSDPYL